MTDDDQRVDPRYDPAFQRGFEGEVSSSLRTRSVEPVPEIDEFDVQEAPRTRTNDVAEPAPEFVAARSFGMRDVGRNPFVITLVVLGLALITGGIAWASQARQAVADLATELDYWYLQASVVGAPLTILTGIAILAGVLFVAAGAWSRRR